MKHDYYTLGAIDGMVHIVYHLVDLGKPQEQRLWYATDKYAWSLADRLGTEVQETSGGVFTDSTGQQWVPDRSRYVLNETVDVLCPKTRAKSAAWFDGAWYKYTRQGWVRL